MLTTLALLLSACGGAKVDNDSANADVLAGIDGTPDLGSALLSVPLQERRLGIVYSEPSAQGFLAR